MGIYEREQFAPPSEVSFQNDDANLKVVGDEVAEYSYNNTDYIYGIIIFPDDAEITCPYIVNVNNAGPTSNEIPYEEYKVLVDSGCIFLPCAGAYGYRTGNYSTYRWGDYNVVGRTWTSTYAYGNVIDCYMANYNGDFPTYFSEQFCGDYDYGGYYPVRLIVE